MADWSVKTRVLHLNNQNQADCCSKPLFTGNQPHGFGKWLNASTSMLLPWCCSSGAEITPSKVHGNVWYRHRAPGGYPCRTDSRWQPVFLPCWRSAFKRSQTTSHLFSLLVFCLRGTSIKKNITVVKPRGDPLSFSRYRQIPLARQR